MAEGKIPQMTWPLKKETINGTTDTNGNIKASVTAKLVLFAWDSEHVFIPFFYGNYWYFRVQRTNANGDALVNTAVSFYVYYI